MIVTRGFDIGDYVIKMTRININGIMATGYVEFINKNKLDENNVTAYINLGQDDLIKGIDYDTLKLHLVDMEISAEIEMTLKLYDNYAIITWVNLKTYQESRWKAKYIDNQEESVYSLTTSFNNWLRPGSESQLIEKLQLNVDQAVFRKKNNYNELFQSSIDISKFSIDFSSMPNFVRAYDDNNNLVLEVNVHTHRIDNKWLFTYSGPKVEYSYGFMNYIVRRNDSIDSLMIMTHKNRAHYFKSTLTNYKESDIKLLRKIPHYYPELNF